MRENSPLN